MRASRTLGAALLPLLGASGVGLSLAPTAAAQRQDPAGPQPAGVVVLARPSLPARASTKVEVVPDPHLTTAQLAAVIDKLVPHVERAALPFLTKPKVRTADEESWAALIAAEFPKARDPSLAVATTFALYLPERDEVVIGPFVAAELVGGGEGGIFAQAIVAHELTHALQDQYFALPSRFRVETKPWRKQGLRILLEGHATLVEEQVAQSLGAANVGSIQRQRLSHSSLGPLHLNGRDYCASLEQESRAALWRALAGEPPDVATVGQRVLAYRKVAKRAAK